MYLLAYALGVVVLLSVVFLVWVFKPRSTRHKPCGGRIVSHLVRKIDPDGDGCIICCTTEIRRCSKCHAVVSQDGYIWDPEDPPTLEDEEFADHHRGEIEDVERKWYAFNDNVVREGS